MADYSTLIDQAGQKWNVDPRLISTIIGIESSGNPKAVGPATSYGNAVGLGQLIPATAKSLGVSDPTDPAQAIPAVAQLLSQNLDRYGNVPQAVAAYHGGTDPANWGPKTQAYVQKVAASYPSGQPAPAAHASAAGMMQAASVNPGADAASRALGMSPQVHAIPQAAALAQTGGQLVDPFADVPAHAGAAGTAPATTQATSAPSGGVQLDLPSDAEVAREIAADQAQSAAKAPAAPASAASAPAGGMVDPFANLDAHPAAAPASTPAQSGGFVSQLGDAASAFGHHVMSPLHGAAQLVEHGVNAAVQAVAPNSDLAHSVQNTVSADDQALAAREQQYQATTPNNAGSYAGAIAGEIAPAVVAGGARLLQGGADVGSALAARLGLGSTGTAATQLAGRAVAGSALGATQAAAAPVTQAGDYAQQKAQQVGTGAVIGAAAPVAGAAAGAVGRYAGNVARSIVDPLTDAGQSRIAQNTLMRFADGGPTNISAAQIVQNSQPTLAEATGNAGIAGLQRTMRDISPNDFAQRESDNAAARLAQVGQTIGTPADIDAAQAARAAQTAPALQQVFANSKLTNPQPVVDAIDSILNGPGGQRTSVESSLGKIRSMIVDPQSGAVTADPATLYQSVRKQIGDMLDTRMTNANPAGLQASRELLGVRDVLDDAIESGAPGFKQYLGDYAAASQPINAMQHLQGLNLTDANGNVTLAKVQNALSNIQKQQNLPGANDAKAITDQQIAQLQGVRDDLLRQSNLGKGRSVGSSTAQNLAVQNMISTMLPGKIGAAVGSIGPAGVGSAVGGGIGMLAGGLPGAGIGASAGGFIGKAIGGAMNGQNASIQNKLTQLLLDPRAGAAALNGGGGAATQTAKQALLNRLLPYLTPSAVSLANGVATHPALPQTP